MLQNWSKKNPALHEATPDYMSVFSRSIPLFTDMSNGPYIRCRFTVRYDCSDY